MCKQPGLRQNNLKFFKRFLYFSDIFLVCSLIWIRPNTFAALIVICTIPTHRPLSHLVFFPPHHVFLAACWSVIPCQQTQEHGAVPSCVCIWRFIRMSPTSPICHFRRSVMSSQRLLPLRGLPPPTRLPATWSSGARSVMAWDVSRLLTRRPHLHRDFIIADIHHQFVFFTSASLLQESHCGHFVVSAFSLFIDATLAERITHKGRHSR